MFHFAPLLFWITERSSNVPFILWEASCLCLFLLAQGLQWQIKELVVGEKKSCGSREHCYAISHRLRCGSPWHFYKPAEARAGCVRLVCRALPHTCQLYGSMAESGCQKGNVASRGRWCVASPRGLCAQKGALPQGCLPGQQPRAAELPEEVTLHPSI